MSVGIGLGSKFTLQLASPDGGLRVLPHDGVNSSMPAYLAFTKQNSLYGTPAFNQGARNPLLTFNNLKRLVGIVSNQQCNDTLLAKDTRNFKDSVLTQPGQALQLQNPLFINIFTQESAEVTALGLPSSISFEIALALLLSSLHSTWAAQLPSVKPLSLLGYTCNNPLQNLDPAKGMVITIPPWFSTSQRIALYHSFKLASLPIQDIVHDYFALLHTYALQRVIEQEKYVIFFDFGHTETTLSLAHLNPKTLTAQCLDYESHIGLGVRDCVDVVLKKVKAKYLTTMAAQGVTKDQLDTIFTLQNQKYLLLWWNAVHKSIEKLTTAQSVTIECQQPFGDADEFEFKYTREEFEKDITPILTQHVLKIVTRLLDRALPPLLATNPGIMSLLSIECTGAGCRIPVLQRLLSEFVWKSSRDTTAPAPLSTFQICSTLNPDEATTRGSAFITASQQVVEKANENGIGKLKYWYQNHPQKWTFEDLTLKPHHSIQYLEVLYAKLEISPQVVVQRYHDLHQYNVLHERDRKLAAFLGQCNKLESLCYEYESNTSKEVQGMIEKTHEWLGEHSSGDYREVDLMIDFFNGVVVDKLTPADVEATHTEELAFLQSSLESESKTTALLNASLKEAHDFKVQSTQDVWRQIQGETNPDVKKWLGDDFYAQISSPGQVARHPNGGSKGTIIGGTTTTTGATGAGAGITATATTTATTVAAALGSPTSPITKLPVAVITKPPTGVTTTPPVAKPTRIVPTSQPVSASPTPTHTISPSPQLAHLRGIDTSSPAASLSGHHSLGQKSPAVGAGAKTLMSALPTPSGSGPAPNAAVTTLSSQSSVTSLNAHPLKTGSYQPSPSPASSVPNLHNREKLGAGALSPPHVASAAAKSPVTSTPTPTPSLTTHTAAASKQPIIVHSGDLDDLFASTMIGTEPPKATLQAAKAMTSPPLSAQHNIQKQQPKSPAAHIDDDDDFPIESTAPLAAFALASKQQQQPQRPQQQPQQQQQQPPQSPHLPQQPNVAFLKQNSILTQPSATKHTFSLDDHDDLAVEDIINSTTPTTTTSGPFAPASLPKSPHQPPLVQPVAPHSQPQHPIQQPNTESMGEGYRLNLQPTQPQQPQPKAQVIPQQQAQPQTVAMSKSLQQQQQPVRSPLPQQQQQQQQQPSQHQPQQQHTPKQAPLMAWQQSQPTAAAPPPQQSAIPRMAWHQQDPQQVAEIQKQNQLKAEKQRMADDQVRLQNEQQRLHAEQMRLQQEQQRLQQNRSQLINNNGTHQDDGRPTETPPEAISSWRAVMSRFNTVVHESTDDCVLVDVKPLSHSQSLSSSHSATKPVQTQRSVTNTPCQVYGRTGDCALWNEGKCAFNHDICDAAFDDKCPNQFCTNVHLTPHAKSVLQAFYDKVMNEQGK